MARTILLADDSPTIQRLVTQTFAGGDFEIVSVSNGEAAIRKLEGFRPDVVLADIYMPGKNGYEVCAFVKTQPSLVGIPVILLVGAFDAFDEATASQAGADAHITKPFEPTALIALVVSVLEKPAESAPAEPALEPGVEIEATEHIVDAALGSDAFASGNSSLIAPVPAVPPLDAPAEQLDANDLLGLEDLFKEQRPSADSLSEQEIDRIADRVIQRLSSQVVENIAWEIVPDIAGKVVREELKRNS